MRPSFALRITSILALGIALTFLNPSRAKAVDQTLDFEGFADQAVLTTQYSGINFAGATVLKQGVSLNAAFPPHSVTNVIYNPSGPMSLVFASAISNFSGYVTYNSGMTIQAFDAMNVLLATATGAYSSNYIGSGNPSNEFLSVAAANITKVVLTGGSGNNFVLDDVTFTGSLNDGAVPEGGLTLAMLGLTFAGIVGFRRKFSI